MTRGVMTRPSTSYPVKYMTIFQHVLNTGKPIEIKSLKTRGECIALRFSMNSWRSALKKENSPLVGQLYGIAVSIVVQYDGEAPMTMKKADDQKRPKNKGHWYVVVRSRDAAFKDALDDLEIELPTFPVEAETQLETTASHSRSHSAQAPVETVSTINAMFAREEDDE